MIITDIITTCTELESAGLLALCLKKVGGLSKMKILEAFWVWTEPHSKRLRVGIDIEKSVLDGKVNLRQRVEVVYVVINRQCLECIRTATDHSWGAVVQLRQRGGHSQSVTKGLSRIENEIWKASLHNLMLEVENAKHGLDMFFKHKNQAEKVVTFITSHMPAKVKVSKKMVSADRKSNKQQYEHAYLVDIVPLVKHDVVLVPRDNGRGSSLMIVNKVSSSVHFVSPVSMERKDMSATKYFTHPFSPLLSPAQLVPFVVLDVEFVVAPVGPATNKSLHSQRMVHSKQKQSSYDDTSTVGEPGEGGRLAEVEVAKESDFGLNDVTYRVLTHLGHILTAGDTVLGFDVSHSTLSDFDVDVWGHSKLSGGGGGGICQDVVLVRKVFKKGEGGGKGEGGAYSEAKMGGEGEEEGGALLEDDTLEVRQGEVSEPTHDTDESNLCV